MLSIVMIAIATSIGCCCSLNVLYSTNGGQSCDNNGVFVLCIVEQRSQGKKVFFQKQISEIV